VNGQYAGVFLGAPLRLAITPHVKVGRNVVRIDPFAPSTARLVICPQ